MYAYAYMQGYIHVCIYVIDVYAMICKYVYANTYDHVYAYYSHRHISVSP